MFLNKWFIQILVLIFKFMASTHIGQAEFVDKLTQQMSTSDTTVSKATTSFVFDQAIELIKNLVKEDIEIRIKGFGTFKKGTMAAKTGKNFLTGKEMNIPERSNCKFKVSAQFKDYLNNK